MIEKMLVLSTAHLTQETCNEWLRSTSTVVAYEKADYGWFIYVGDDEAYKNASIPADLMACIQHARSSQVEWLMFDRDYDAVDGLPFYEW